MPPSKKSSRQAPAVGAPARPANEKVLPAHDESPLVPGSDVPLAALLKALAGRTMDYGPALKKFPDLTAEKVRKGLRLAAERVRQRESRETPVATSGSQRIEQLKAAAAARREAKGEPRAAAVAAPGDMQVEQPKAAVGTRNNTRVEPSLDLTPKPLKGRGFEDVGMGRLIPGPQWQTFVELGLTPGRPVSELDRIVANIDGCSKGNPGPAAVGVTFSTPDGETLAEGCAHLGRMTNNAAEYHALIAALAQAAKWGVGKIEIRTDSELMARQMGGSYEVKSPLLFPLVKKARELRRRFAWCAIRHVPREQNRRADQLANLAIDRLKAPEQG